MAYEQIDGPLGPARGDHQAALTAWVIASVNRDPKKTPPKLSDFLPTWDREAAEQPWQDQLTAARQWTQLLGGTVAEA